MNTVRTFDATKVSFSVNGITMSGYAEGTGIKVSRSNDTFKKVTGMDGITSRCKVGDRSGEITITLSQTSPSNAILSALATLDEATGKGVVPGIVADLSGESVYVTAAMWIRKPADSEFGTELTNREWVFDCANLTMATNGNVLL
jgi:hypothetical protein